MEKLLQAWSRKDWVHSVQITTKLASNGLTIEDLRKWLKENLQTSPTELSRQKGKSIKPAEKTCPKCGKMMNGSTISKMSNKYKEGYRTYWLCGAACCPGKGCGYEEWSKLTIEEWKKKLSTKRR